MSYLVKIFLFCSVLNVKNYLGATHAQKPTDLVDLLIENLRADPFLDNRRHKRESTKFLDEQSTKFLHLLEQKYHASRNEVHPKNLINVTYEATIPTTNQSSIDDVRFFYQQNHLLAVSLESKRRLTMYNQTNEIYAMSLNYTTNLAVVQPINTLQTLIVAGNESHIRIFRITLEGSIDVRVVQTIIANGPVHIATWEQDRTHYLSVLSKLSMATKNNLITIYKWLGKHFDETQTIDYRNIRKVVPFTIYSSHFLAVVKGYRTEYLGAETKPYSEILKYDMSEEKFKPHRRLLTYGYTDIKFFNSRFNGEEHHLLIVIHHSPCKECENNGTAIDLYKYEEQYFLPFQLLKTSAVQWQPVRDSQGHAALIAITPEGLKGYIYGAEQFFETPIEFRHRNSSTLDLKSVKSAQFYDVPAPPILVISGENSVSAYSVNFTILDYKEDSLQSQLLNWCMKSRRQLESSSLVVDIELKNEDLKNEEEQKKIAAALYAANQTIYELEDALSDLIPIMAAAKDKALPISDFSVDNIIFNNNTLVKALRSRIINAVPNILDKIIDVEKQITLKESDIEFDTLIVENLTFDKLNGRHFKDYIKTNSDVILGNVSLSGSITFSRDLTVVNRINGVKATKESLVLNNCDQTYPSDLVIEAASVGNLLTKSVNNIPIAEEIAHLEHLQANSLGIGGFLNGLKLREVQQNALNKTGSQILEVALVVDDLTVKAFTTSSGISGQKIPQDFVLINSGQYVIDRNVTFSKNLEVDELEVTLRLDNIQVNDHGHLQVLWTNWTEVQYVPGKVSLDSLVVTDLIKLRNNIHLEGLNENFKPLLTVNETIEVPGNVTILEGDTLIIQHVSFGDLKSGSGNISLKNTLSKGIKLTDTRLPGHFTFTRPIHVDNVNVAEINSQNVREWLQKNCTTPQYVSGHKTVLGDIHLEGPELTVGTINGINLDTLEKRILKTHGPQEIRGDFALNELAIARNSTLYSNRTYYANLPSDGTLVIAQSVPAASLKTKNLRTRGLINSFNATKLFRDTVKKAAKFKAIGTKHFHELHVANMHILDKNSTLVQLLKQVNNDEITLEGNVDFLNGIHINQLEFNHSLNGISKKDFDTLFAVQDDSLITVSIPAQIDELIVYGNVSIGDNMINGKDVTAISEDTVKNDEDFVFKNVEIGETVSIQGPLLVDGHIEDLDLDSIVEGNSKIATELRNKTILTSVWINGTLFVERALNGFELNKLCQYSNPNTQLKSLKIQGNVTFTKGPTIETLNNINVPTLMETLWFKNQPTLLSGLISFKNGAIFEGSLKVQELLDAVPLTLLSKNYLSKSKNQVVAARITFDDVVTFSNVSAQTVEAPEGKVNGISIENLLTTALIQGEDQMFETTPHFEEIDILGLSSASKCTVNGFNLQTDLMRYDKTNRVTGLKMIENLDVETLLLAENARVQNVDVSQWIQNTVLTEGTFRINGKTAIKSAGFKKGLSLRGNLNNKPFNKNSIMLAHEHQAVRGKKTFSLHSNQSIQFKSLNVNGRVNNIDLSYLLQDQVNKYENSTIKSELIFHKNVKVQNVIVRDLYNGVNMSALINKMSNLRSLDSLKGKFSALLSTGLKLYESLMTSRSTFFKYFKEILVLDEAYEVFGIQCADGAFRLVAFYFINGKNMLKTYEWNPEVKKFDFKGENIEGVSKPQQIEQINLGKKDYIYIERSEQPTDAQAFGKLIEIIDKEKIYTVAEMKRVPSLAVISFTGFNGSQSCVGFISTAATALDIFCENASQYALVQSIRMQDVYMAASLAVNDTIYLFLAKRSSAEFQGFLEPSVVVYKSTQKSPRFVEIQTIYEGARINSMAAGCINGIPYLALSFDSQQRTIESKRVSIKKLDSNANQFIHYQYLLVEFPLSVHFITETTFEPLLLVSAMDISAPLQIFKYNGIAGFNLILKGSALANNLKVRLIGKGHFLAVKPYNGAAGQTILAAVIKGSVAPN